MSYVEGCGTCKHDDVCKHTAFRKRVEEITLKFNSNTKDKPVFIAVSCHSFDPSRPVIRANFYDYAKISEDALNKTDITTAQNTTSKIQ